MKNVLIFAIMLIIFTGLFYGSLETKMRKVAARPKNCQKERFPKPPCCGSIEQSNKIINIERIVGGTDVTKNELPWLVLILPIQCGGSLINSRWVLSAAHCFELPDSYEVKLGALRCDEDYCEPSANSFSVKRIIKHESYRHFINDIALLQLKESVTFSASIKPICLPFKAVHKSNLTGTKAVVAGWGYAGTGSYSPVLKTAMLPIWDFKKCNKLFRSINEVNHICAGGEKYIDACDHDSGGPLFLQLPNARENNPYYQIGLVSFGQRVCGKKGIPGVYENVTIHINWIKKTISKHK